MNETSLYGEYRSGNHHVLHVPALLPVFFAGVPLIEQSHGSDAVGSILKLVTAAVVGVILNLTVFLGRDVLFPGGLTITITRPWRSLNLSVNV